MQNFLDSSERERLEYQHKYERNGWIHDRIKAVLLYDKGWTCRIIAEALFITHEAARQHTLDYEVARKLSPENGGSSSKLNKTQRNSPNLNPIERLWKLANEWVLNNKYYENFSEFRNSLLSFLGSLSDPPPDLLKILKSRITDNFRAIGSILSVNSST